MKSTQGGQGGGGSSNADTVREVAWVTRLRLREARPSPRADTYDNSTVGRGG